VQPDVWENLAAEWPCFPFAGKPGVNVDLEARNNHLEYFEFFFVHQTLWK
jgi:hypothetical protein